MGRCKPPLKVFHGGPTSKANTEHARHWGSCLGGRCPPRLQADPSPCSKGDAVGQTMEVLVGGREGGRGQHGGPFSSTQGAPIIISFCKASFRLLRYPVSEQNHFLFDFVNQSRRYNNY